MMTKREETLARALDRAIDDNEKLRAEIVRLVNVSQTAWQPIETAPKDGTPLLLGWPRFFHPLVGHCEDGVWGQLESDFGFEAFQSQPTHWMPLPAGPALSRRSETINPNQRRPDHA